MEGLGRDRARVERLAPVLAIALLALYGAGVAMRIWLFARTPGLGSGFLDDYGLLLAFTGCTAVGALLVWKRPRHPMGWMLAAVGVVVATLPGLESYAAYRMTTVGRPDGFATFGAWANGVYWIPLLALILVYVPLLFPDGRLPSRGWRWVLWLVTAAVVGVTVPQMFVSTLRGQDVAYTIANPIGIAGFDDWDATVVVGVLQGIVVVGIAAAVASLTVRFRRSRGTERQQIKWLLLALAPSLLLPVVDEVGVVGDLLSILIIVGVPAAIATAVLRHRLYDVDRVFSRTLAYGLVSGILVGIYLAGVLALGAVARSVADDRANDLVVALSTLLAAAAFQPVRQRVQSLVDRRFNRARYDARRTSEAFAQRLRHQVDLAEVHDDLAATVRQAVGPTTLSLWPTGGPRE